MDSKAQYLLSLGAIRERARMVWGAAQAGDLSHFDLHEDRLDGVVDFVTSVIKVQVSIPLTDGTRLISLIARFWSRQL